MQVMIEGLRSHGMSFSEIAQRSGLSRQTIWRFANGEARAPTLESYHRVEQLAVKAGVLTKDWKP